MMSKELSGQYMLVQYSQTSEAATTCSWKVMLRVTSAHSDQVGARISTKFFCTVALLVFVLLIWLWPCLSRKHQEDITCGSLTVFRRCYRRGYCGVLQVLLFAHKYNKKPIKDSRDPIYMTFLLSLLSLVSRPCTTVTHPSSNPNPTRSWCTTASTKHYTQYRQKSEMKFWYHGG
ncbi:hypothetical protein L873DRAFT_511118 [Choiromyces venosus 120613-1]|uniref:Uncharacterized protein n=1 Tax=Choiromyces venosus 120613-1 TaxID=1336337 RepID=A0A3N4IUZ4_9PEZI|nr:hypothetical protein L873DRAFT_511118 [Choiromyces venosus 120613-1]